MREELLVKSLIERLPGYSEVVYVQRSIARESVSGGSVLACDCPPDKADELVSGIFEE
jgi:hypothetical protein